MYNHVSHDYIFHVVGQVNSASMCGLQKMTALLLAVQTASWES